MSPTQSAPLPSRTVERGRGAPWPGSGGVAGCWGRVRVLVENVSRRSGIAAGPSTRLPPLGETRRCFARPAGLDLARPRRRMFHQDRWPPWRDRAAARLCRAGTGQALPQDCRRRARGDARQNLISRDIVRSDLERGPRAEGGGSIVALVQPRLGGGDEPAAAPRQQLPLAGDHSRESRPAGRHEEKGLSLQRVFQAGATLAC